MIRTSDHLQAPGLLGGSGEVVSKINAGALTIRIGFWAPLWYNYDKEP